MRKNAFNIVCCVIVCLLLELYFVSISPLLGNVSSIKTNNIGGIYLKDIKVTQKYYLTENTLNGVALMFFAGDEGVEKLSIKTTFDGSVIDKRKISRRDIIDSKYKLVFKKKYKNVSGKLLKVEIKAKGDTGITALISDEKYGDGDTLTSTNLGQDLHGANLCFGIIQHNIRRLHLYLILAVGTIVIFFIVFLVNKLWKKEKEECQFLIVYSTLAIVCLFAIPIFNTPDEPSHFYRAYEVSTGNMIAKMIVNDDGKEDVGDYLPSALSFNSQISSNIDFYKVKKMLKSNIDPDDVQFVSFANTASYAPGTYIPHVIGIVLFRLFTKDALIIAYGARLFNIITIGLLLFYAIKIIPYGKRLMLLVSFIPMNIHQFNSLSPDGFVYALIMFLIANILNMRCSRQYLLKRDYVCIFLLVFIICQCKIVYAPICLCLFLIPKEKFRTTKRYVLSIILVGAMATIICLGWYKISSALLIEINTGAMPELQTSLILHNPIYFLKVMVHTIEIEGNSWFLTFFGHSMGWLNINTSFCVLVAYFVLLLKHGIYRHDVPLEVKKQISPILLGTSILVILLIFASLYIQWTPYLKDIIQGIQGRYFLPIAFLFMVPMLPKQPLASGGGQSRIIYQILTMNVAVFSILIANAV